MATSGLGALTAHLDAEHVSNTAVSSARNKGNENLISMIESKNKKLFTKKEKGKVNMNDRPDLAEAFQIVTELRVDIVGHNL